jgi:hypothetical protein
MVHLKCCAIREYALSLLTVRLRTRTWSVSLKRSIHSLYWQELVGPIVYSKSFPGWDSVGGFVSHLNFIAEHDRHIEPNGLLKSFCASLTTSPRRQLGNKALAR